MGDAGGGLFEATAGRGLFLDEYAELAKIPGCTVTWTALLAGLALGKGDHEEQLAISEKMTAAGLRVFPQVTPRPLNFEYQFKEPFLFEAMSIFKPVSAADFEGKKKLYQDPEFRTIFREKMETVRESFRSSFAKTVISQCLAEPALDERKLFDVAAERNQAPSDLALDLSLKDNLETRFRMPVANHNEDEVQPLLESSSTVLGLSDAGAHASQLCDACQPTYLLSRWVREKQVFTIEEAVRMLTSRPADVAGLTDRGLLAEGRPADITIFDPETVGAGPLQRVYDFPGGADRLISKESGICAVIVNGVPIRRDGADVLSDDATLPGGVLRRKRAAN
jgi:N-acyl-D-aspartate/D-glutamate deacylase